jgi:hypothetical protein
MRLQPATVEEGHFGVEVCAVLGHAAMVHQFRV